MRTKPKLLDLYCGAGGAAMGYYQAGFEVVGVDIKTQPRYPFEFVQADALEYLAEHGRHYDAIHASPPCQRFSIMRNLPWLKDKDYPDQLTPTRKIVECLGKPYVVENVMGAHLAAGYLCGRMFGLRFYNHRAFDTSFFWLQPGHPKHDIIFSRGRLLGHGGGRRYKVAAEFGCDWMTNAERSNAIPPVFTEFIGQALQRQLK